MKLKIIFFPLALVLAVFGAIWFVWPQYTVVMGQRQILAEKQTQMSALEERTHHVEQMYAQLDQNQSATDFLFRYIPTTPDDEYIINAINKAAVDSGVGLVMVNIQRDGTMPFFTKRSVNPVPSDTLSTTDATVIPLVKKNPLKEFTADTVVIGSYEGVKKFMAAVHSIDRLHGVSLASIKNYEVPAGAPQAAAPEGVAPADRLIAHVVASFAYVADVTVPRGAMGDVFDRSMDMTYVQGMQGRYATAPALEAVAGGKPNPFAQ